jgi:hypothetical protein
MDKTQMTASKYAKQLPELVRACEAIRKDKDNPTDISFAEMVQEVTQLSMEGFYKELGVDPSQDTINLMVNLPDPNFRWLIPEIYRNAIRTGLRKNSIYQNLIAAEQTVSQTTVKMPAINMSEAAPRKVGVAETITTGSVSFDSKDVKISKIGRGIKVPYEVTQYVALNIVNLFLEDFGVKLRMGLDALAVQTLLNGDQKDGSDSGAVVGITNTTNGTSYRDLLRLYVRLSRLGKNMSTMVGGEDMSIDILELLVNTRLVGVPRANVDIKTPIPENSDYFVHGIVPANQVIMVDKTGAMIKLNAQPLLVETDKIIQNQVNETYATLTTGYATIYRDSRIILDKSLLFSGNGFPTWMDPTAQELVTFD